MGPMDTDEVLQRLRDTISGWRTGQVVHPIQYLVDGIEELDEQLSAGAPLPQDWR